MGHCGKMSLDSRGKDTYAWKIFSLFFFLVRKLLCFPGLYYHSSAKGLSSVLPRTAVPWRCAAVVFSEVWGVDKCQSTTPLPVLTWSLLVGCSVWREFSQVELDSLSLRWFRAGSKECQKQLSLWLLLPRVRTRWCCVLAQLGCSLGRAVLLACANQHSLAAHLYTSVCEWRLKHPAAVWPGHIFPALLPVRQLCVSWRED